MTIKANKGEHSEILAFLRLLHVGRIQVADAQGAPKQAWLKVISIKRPEEDSRTYLISEENITIEDQSGTQLFSVKRADLGALADRLFSEIVKGSGSSFGCSATDEAIALFRINNLKAGSNAKADLFLTIASPVFENESSQFGFSIKSEIGGLPTLLNAGATHFEYRISDCSADDALRVQEEAPRAIRKKFPGPMTVIPAIYKQAKGRLEFERVVEPVFEQNLKMIDTSFPLILADVLKHAYLSGDLDLKVVVDLPALLDELKVTLGLSEAETKRLIKHKLKELLRQSALGMNPGRPWEGQVEAHGGWIIVGENGALRCFHLTNDDDFREYLLNSCKFDTPSMSRHEAGYVYRQTEGSVAMLRLSLQIRFK